MSETDRLELETTSALQTELLGRCLARLAPVGAVLALRGELASGKTCLVRGMAFEYGEGDAVHSPTFTLVNEYGNGRKLYHLDLYRLSTVDEVVDLGYDELFEPDGVCVVEWAERAQLLLPERRVDVLLEHAGGDRRKLTIQNQGILPPGWQQQLQGVVQAA